MSSDAPETTYYGLPILHSPVWTWQIGLYLFVGGAAGMSAVIAFAAILGGYPIAFVRAALAIALAGVVVSPVLLVWDLGRPSRFLNMLRVFKWRSAMSVGVWTLVLFSGFVAAAMFVVHVLDVNPGSSSALAVLAFALAAGAALTGAVLATYTGVLLGATAVPAWARHHRLLPVHFGVVALGSAAALLEVSGYAIAPLNALGLAASAVEIAIAVALERRRGTSGLLLRGAGALTGPAPFVLRIAGFTTTAAGCFVLGAILSRYGWLAAGRTSTLAAAKRLSS